MEKAALLQSLERFTAKGYLREIHSDEAFSLYTFLDDLYVGFHHRKSNSVATGALLAEGEAQIILRSNAAQAVELLLSKEERCISFDDALFSRCDSFFRRKSLKKKLLREYPANTDMDWMHASFPDTIGTAVIGAYCDARESALQTHRKYLKRTIRLGLISLLCFCMAAICFFSIPWLRQFDPVRPAAAFDKTSADIEYTFIEADVLAEFASVTSSHNGSSTYTTYYLWGNRETGAFGILSFSDISDEVTLFPNEKTCLVLDEPLTLYGSAHYYPSQLGSIYYSHFGIKEESSISIPDRHITMPDGTDYYVPGYTIPFPEVTINDPFTDVYARNAADALTLFIEHGFPLGADAPLGKYGFFGTTTQETTTSALSLGVSAFSNLLALASFVLLAIVVYFGFKADVMEAILRDPELLRGVYEQIASKMPDNVFVSDSPEFDGTATAVSPSSGTES